MIFVHPTGSVLHRMNRLLLTLFAVILLTSQIGQAVAQDSLRIVAVVNDELITGYDLNQRIRLILGGGNLPASAEQRSRLAAQILRSMVDERLQMQEAKRLNIRVEPKEIQEALARIATQNGVEPNQLAERLKSDGLNIETLEAQVEANLAWRQVVRRRGSRFATVSEDEIDEAMARHKESMNKPSLLVSQIFLNVDSPQEENQILGNATRLLEEVRGGGSFASLATQFSQDPSARTGGDMGWLQPGQMPEEVEKILTDMPVGAMSMPIRSSEGYHIVVLRDRRAPVGGPSDDNVEVSLQQIVIPLPASGRPEDVASQINLAQTISETVNGCDDMNAAARELGTTSPGSMAMLRVGDMAAGLRKVVLDLKVGQASRPLQGDGNLRIIMVCERKEAPSNLPIRLDIQRMLSEQKLELQARRLLRDLRQTAFVDIRA